jgi:hypothetical protein
MEILKPQDSLLTAAFRSHSSVMKFGALALDRKERILAAGWNGRPTDRDMAVAARLEHWLRARAEEQGLDPDSINLVPGKGFRRTLHAEGRALINLAAARKLSAVTKIARVRIAAILPNEKYFGIKKMAPGEKELWATCRHCARLFEIAGTHGEMLVSRGGDEAAWMAVNPRRAFASATAERIVPRNFWDAEKKTVSLILRKDRKNPPPVIETDFMIWQRLDR